VNVAGNQLIGSPAGGAAITLGVDSGTQLLNAAVTTPSGVPNPVTSLVTTLTSASSPLSAVTAPLSGATGGASNPASGLTSAVTGLTSGLTGSLANLGK
jgi:hypothetical protein